MRVSARRSRGGAIRRSMTRVSTPTADRSPRSAIRGGARQMEKLTPLPTGTVTFLFTDIEGSTRLWEQHPEAMPLALTRHDLLLRQAIEAHGGHVFKTVGDQFCAAFAAAPQALAAALAAQRALQIEPWTQTGPLRVRVALHTATAQ